MNTSTKTNSIHYITEDDITGSLNGDCLLEENSWRFCSLYVDKALQLDSRIIIPIALYTSSDGSSSNATVYSFIYTDDCGETWHFSTDSNGNVVTLSNIAANVSYVETYVTAPLRGPLFYAGENVICLSSDAAFISSNNGSTFTKKVFNSTFLSIMSIGYCDNKYFLVDYNSTNKSLSFYKTTDFQNFTLDFSQALGKTESDSQITSSNSVIIIPDFEIAISFCSSIISVIDIKEKKTLGSIEGAYNGNSCGLTAKFFPNHIAFFGYNHTSSSSGNTAYVTSLFYIFNKINRYFEKVDEEKQSYSTSSSSTKKQLFDGSCFPLLNKVMYIKNGSGQYTYGGMGTLNYNLSDCNTRFVLPDSGLDATTMASMTVYYGASSSESMYMYVKAK